MNEIAPQADAHLVSVTALADQLYAPDICIVDCRFDLLQPAAGRSQWCAGHIPGARYAHLDDDLAARRGPATGRHPLPDAADFAARLADWGITPATRVIAYDAAGGALAARLWWLLRWAGHQRVALLDGGLPAWTAAGLPLETGAVTPGTKVTTPYPVRPGGVPTVTTAELQRRLAAGVTLLDARDSQRFAGVTEPIDARAGHVPGARNWPFSNNLDADGRFLPVDELQGRLGELAGRTGPRRYREHVRLGGDGLPHAVRAGVRRTDGRDAGIPGFVCRFMERVDRRSRPSGRGWHCGELTVNVRPGASQG